MNLSAGNGHLAWIRQDAASLSRVTWQLKVSLAARRLTVLEAGKVIERFTVAIGRPGAPTPTGRFAVTDRLTTGNPAGPYVCCILALSAIQPSLPAGWSGGNRVAIHGTLSSSDFGRAVSAGCVHASDATLRYLMRIVPLGTPVVIRP